MRSKLQVVTFLNFLTPSSVLVSNLLCQFQPTLFLKRSQLFGSSYLTSNLTDLKTMVSRLKKNLTNMFDPNNLNGVEKMILKKVTQYMKDNGVRYVGIYLDENDAPGFEVYTEPVKTFTLSQVNSIVNGNNTNDTAEQQPS